MTFQMMFLVSLGFSLRNGVLYYKDNLVLSENPVWIPILLKTHVAFGIL